MESISASDRHDTPPNAEASSKKRAKSALVAAEDGAGPCKFTLLACKPSLRLVKTFDIAGNFVAVTPYSKAAEFGVRINQTNGAADLYRALLTLEPLPRVCIIRGAPAEGINRDQTRRAGAFVDVPRHWAMLDIDKIPMPAGADLLADPADAARRVFDVLAGFAPELEGVSAVVQFSASAGLRDMAEAEEAAGMPPRWRLLVKPDSKPTISAHIWICLDEPQDGKALKRWAEAVNARAGFGLIDCQPFATVQPHYTGAPIFGPTLRDPLAGRRTHLIEGEAEAATLDIPAVQIRPARVPGATPGQAMTGPGYGAKLSAIGGPGGFNGPILMAAGAFVRANWPNPDVDALIADVRARVLAADPGERSGAEMDRYASDAFIREKAEWWIEKEEQNRAERAEEAATRAAAAAAEAMPPTFPDRAVTLLEARRDAGEALVRFASRVRAGEAPKLLLLVTVGGGKTRAAIEAIPNLLRAGRAAGRGPVLFLHPRHELGDQIAADIRAKHPGIHVAVWRGMDADNPAEPGQSMCTEPAFTAAARKASMDSQHACNACPKAQNGCAYIVQAGAGAVRPVDVWIAAHHLMTRAPFAGWPREVVDGARRAIAPSAVIVDENPAGNWLAGMEGKSSIAIGDLESGPTDSATLDADDVEHLQNFRRIAAAAFFAQPNGQIWRAGMEYFAGAPARTMRVGNAVVDVEQDKPPGMEWSALEWATKPRIKFPPGVTMDEAFAIYAEAAEKGFKRMRPTVARLLAEFMAKGDARSVNIDKWDDEQKGPMLSCSWREDIHPSWQNPAILFLGATTSPEVLRAWVPELEVCEIEVKAPHQRVLQIASREFGKTWAVQNVSRLADCVLAEVAAANGETLAVLQKDAEQRLRAELKRRGCERDPVPEGAEDDTAVYRFPSGAVLHLAHHGAVEGVNLWEGVATVLVIGRPATNKPTGEWYGEIIRGGAVDRLPSEDTAWPKRWAAIRMADGTGHPVEQSWHPDSLVEAYRWTVSEGAMVQAIGRARGVQRNAWNPLRVVVLAGAALPLTVDEVATWEDYQPDRVTVAAAEAALFGRALPLAAADLAEAMGWKIDNAKFHLKACPLAGSFERVGSLIGDGSNKHSYPFKTQTRYRYRKGLRGRWSEALAPVEAGRDALEVLLGPLAAFEPMPMAEPVMEAAPMPEPVSAFVPGVALVATARLVTLPEPVRIRRSWRRPVVVEAPISEWGKPWRVEAAG